LAERNGIQVARKDSMALVGQGKVAGKQVQDAAAELRSAK
jgi:hypothetical protein